MSGEFVFESKYAKGDADLIQFATGLKWVPTIYQDEGRRTAIAIGYGIMDCESSVVYVTLDVIDSMLQPVNSKNSDNKNDKTTTLQVVDTMKVNQEWDLDLATFTKMSETMDGLTT